MTKPSLTKVQTNKVVSYLCLSCGTKFSGPPGPLKCPVCRHLYVRAG
jgi:rubrerythrin